MKRTTTSHISNFSGGGAGEGKSPGGRKQGLRPRETKGSPFGWRSVRRLWAKSGWFLADRLKGGTRDSVSPLLSFRMVPVEASCIARWGSQWSDHHLERFKLDGRWDQWPVAGLSGFVLVTRISIS